MKFSNVLSPISDHDFFDKYWNKKPLLMKGFEEKFKELPSSQKLPSMCIGKLNDNYWEQSNNLSAQITSANSNGQLIHLNNVPISMYAQLYNTGHSLCFNDVSSANKKLKELAEDVSNVCEFNNNAIITCYLSPPNTTGVLHYDCQHTFFIQSEGVKYWRISDKPAIKNPHENFLYHNADQEYFNDMKDKGYEILLPSDCGYRDIILNKGDFLYLPPGYYHSAQTKKEKSFHYTLTLETISFWNFIMSSLHLGFLKNCSEFNEDIRSLPDSDRNKHFSTQLEEFKKMVNNLSVKDMENILKK